MAKEFWDKYTEQLAQKRAMEMLLGARWTPPAFGMPGYYHRIVKTIQDNMIYSHEEFYDENGNKIENPWKTSQASEVPATYPYNPPK